MLDPHRRQSLSGSWARGIFHSTYCRAKHGVGNKLIINPAFPRETVIERLDWPLAAERQTTRSSGQPCCTYPCKEWWRIILQHAVIHIPCSIAQYHTYNDPCFASYYAVILPAGDRIVDCILSVAPLSVCHAPALKWRMKKKLQQVPN